MLTPAGDGTLVRWAAEWDATLGGRMVWRGLSKAWPAIVADLVTAAEQHAGSLPLAPG